MGTDIGTDITATGAVLANQRADGASRPILLSPGEVAARFGVHVATVARWSNDGRLRAIVTPGGHRRYRREDIEEILGEPW